MERFGSKWLAEHPMDNRFNPVELTWKSRAWVVIRNDGRGRGVDVMRWDVLNGIAKFNSLREMVVRATGFEPVATSLERPRSSSL